VIPDGQIDEVLAEARAIEAEDEGFRSQISHEGKEPRSKA
jgi:hypothetical protein